LTSFVVTAYIIVCDHKLWFIYTDKRVTAIYRRRITVTGTIREKNARVAL
jgi:hypothetical protein